nr:WhiB family transcriptional regulator [Acidipropionibacterium virtanenii]
MTGDDDDDWTLLANCRGMADALFPDGKEQRRARRICVDCRVRARCLAEALDNRIEWGVWGGMTERERRRLLRERPGVTCWRDVLESEFPDGEDSVSRQQAVAE